LNSSILFLFRFIKVFDTPLYPEVTSLYKSLP